VIDYLTHYYKLGTQPFQSLSALTDEEAEGIMQGLSDDTPYGARFKDPLGYMRDRRQTEQWVRDQFIAKGGQPRASYPIPMVLGSSPWIMKNAPDPAAHGEIRIPLSVFTEQDVSFTYPDSMISLWFGRDKPPEYYSLRFTERSLRFPKSSPWSTPGGCQRKLGDKSPRASCSLY
jgi:hypothetical protein